MQGGDYFAPDSTEILIRTTATQRGSLLERLLYRLHSAFVHFHSAGLERHWHAMARASRRLDPNRPS